MIIFWHHVGREHGENGYAADIKKNTKDVIENCLANKKKFAETKSKNRFIKYDEVTLVELPALNSNENFIIVYCLDKGLQFSFGLKKQYPNWLIDIVEVEEIEKDVYCVHDLFIDIPIDEKGNYQVLDMEDFHVALRYNIITEKTSLKTLSSLSNILNELNNFRFPHSFLSKIKDKYMK